MGDILEDPQVGAILKAARERERIRRLARDRATKLAEQAMEDLEQLETLEAESPLARLTARALVANVYATLAVEIAIRDQTKRICADLERPDLH
jgi:hypothetical protein